MQPIPHFVMVSPSHLSFSLLIFCLPGGGVDDVIRNHAGASLYDAQCDRVMKSRGGKPLGRAEIVRIDSFNWQKQGFRGDPTFSGCIFSFCIPGVLNIVGPQLAKKGDKPTVDQVQHLVECYTEIMKAAIESQCKKLVSSSCSCSPEDIILPGSPLSLHWPVQLPKRIRNLHRSQDCFQHSLQSTFLFSGMFVNQRNLYREK